MKRIALGLLLSAASVAPALAADIVYGADPVVSAPMVVEAPMGFNGLYIGGQLGGAFNSDTPDALSISPSFGLNTPVTGAGFRPDGSPTFAAANSGFAANTIGAAFGNSYASEFDSGFVGGVHVGYDWQFDGLVVGLVGDINATDVSITQSAFSNTPAVYSAERSLDYLMTGRVRVGALVTERALAYATGGVAYGEVDYSFSTDSPVVTGNARSLGTARNALVFEDDSDVGYTVGGGLEVLLTDNMSFGAEYLYTNLGDGGSFTRLDGGPFDGNAANGGATTGGFTDFGSGGDFDFHTISAKLSYRFN